MEPGYYVIGADFGTDSVRSVIINSSNGQEVSSAVFYYPRWKQQLYCNPSSHQYRQHPSDYLEGIETSVRQCIEQAGPEVAKRIKAISVDTTGSTPVAVDKTGTPLCFLPGMENNPNALFVLWKDHTSTAEAEEINRHAEKYPVNYLQFVGGIYSSEWFWAKLLHILREDEAIRKNIFSFVEHCDWIPYVLTGGTDARLLKRGVCSAGHKALYAVEFGGLPPDSFFSELDPVLKGFTERLFTRTYTSAEQAGTLSAEWAAKLGLPHDVVVGIGAFDCHMGAVGGQIEPYYLSKVMGTSTCDILVAPKGDMENKLVKGICGQVDGSVIPGMIGLEAGQSAFGDAYAWFKNLLSWPLQEIEDVTLRDKISDSLISRLSAEAAKLPLHENDELALDWLNGRRTPDANQLVQGAFTGLHLGTDAPRMFKALVEATCFGAKAITDRFVEEGIPVKGLIALGGVARKSPFVMQTMADVMNMPIRIHSSEQTCAAGAAMFAATAAGLYPTVEDAMKAMGQGFDKEYKPIRKNVALYKKRFKRYKKLGAFAAR